MDRALPHNIQAEQAVIGAVMLVPDSLWRVYDLLAPDDFFRGDHRLIWTAIRDRADSEKPYDTVTLTEWFEQQGKLELIGDGAYLTELATTTPSAANILGWAEIVRAKALARRVIAAGTDMVNEAFEANDEPSTLLANTQVRIQELMPKERGGLVAVSETLRPWYDDLRARHERESAITGLETPWPDFTEATHGLQDGELIICAARPSMGKSIFALNMAHHAASQKQSAAVFSIEMNRQQLVRRMIAAAAGILHDALLAPRKMEDEHWNRVTQAMKDLRGLPLHLDDTPALNINQLMARARALQAKLERAGQPLRLIVVDHIHDMEIDAKLARFEYGRIAQGLKTLAKDFGCPVVALGQLSRNLHSRQDKRPNMSDLRESGEIEQKADVIVFLHREEYYNRETHLRGVVEAIIAKGRDIEAGQTINLRNDFAHMALRPWDGPLPQAPAPDEAPRQSRPSSFFRPGRRSQEAA